ncbi:MAG TPA: TetR family transcriptional regulator C-terminal domain-containing protein [Smithella sp.]|nr:TetR family transcriptional regulator C-terminal domain-containing protein [Smithella sp.]
MAKEATRQAIIQEGAKLIHSKGFVNTGIQEIITAAGVPKGSFYFYFKNKDDFGAGVIDYFSDLVISWFEKYNRDHTIAPLVRLERFFDESNRFYEKIGCTCGCPIGNLSQEMSDLSETMRNKLFEAYGRTRSIIKDCIAEAKEQGAISSKEDAEELAVFVLNGWEGALIDMKVSKSIRPLNIFKKVLFEKILTA